jgi:hypothetical protein
VYDVSVAAAGDLVVVAWLTDRIVSARVSTNRGRSWAEVAQIEGACEAVHAAAASDRAVVAWNGEPCDEVRGETTRVQTWRSGKWGPAQVVGRGELAGVAVSGQAGVALAAMAFGEGVTWTESLNDGATWIGPSLVAEIELPIGSAAIAWPAPSLRYVIVGIDDFSAGALRLYGGVGPPAGIDPEPGAAQPSDEAWATEASDAPLVLPARRVCADLLDYQLPTEAKAGSVTLSGVTFALPAGTVLGALAARILPLARSRPLCLLGSLDGEALHVATDAFEACASSATLGPDDGTVSLAGAVDGYGETGGKLTFRLSVVDPSQRWFVELASNGGGLCVRARADPASEVVTEVVPTRLRACGTATIKGADLGVRVTTDCEGKAARGAITIPPAWVHPILARVFTIAKGHSIRVELDRNFEAEIDRDQITVYTGCYRMEALTSSTVTFNGVSLPFDPNENFVDSHVAPGEEAGIEASFTSGWEPIIYLWSCEE